MSDGQRSGRSTGRVSCKSTELKRCSVIEMRWNKYEVSLASPVWTQIRRPSSEIKFRAVELKTPRFSTAIGSNLYAEDRVEKFSVFLAAVISATIPASVAALSTLEAANGLTTVTPETNERPPCHGIKVSPSERLPSCLSSPEGYYYYYY